MKNYEEVTKDVFRKSEELIARNERRRNTIMTIGMSACCLAAVCGVGTIAWNRARVSTVPAETTAPAAQFVSDDYASTPGASDTVTSNASSPTIVSSGLVNPAVSKNPSAMQGYMIRDEISGVLKFATTSITGFKVEDTEEKIAPDNGQIHISKALSAAMEKYGGAVTQDGFEITYQVVITYLQDRQTIPITEAFYNQESARQKEQTGRGLNFETIGWDWGAQSEHTIWADFTKAEIENFTANPNYGYVIDLYDNYHGNPITDPDGIIIFNGGSFDE